jgi:hypothetical protein
VLIRYDPKCSVLTIELPQFYYSTMTAASIRNQRLAELIQPENARLCPLDEKNRQVCLLTLRQDY